MLFEIDSCGPAHLLSFVNIQLSGLNVMLTLAIPCRSLISVIRILRVLRIEEPLPFPLILEGISVTIANTNGK